MFTVVALQCAIFVGLIAHAAAQTFAYVPNSTSNDISIIDAATNSVIATLPGGQLPFEAAAAPDGKRVYVANRVSADLTVIDTTTNTVETTITVGQQPGDIIIGVAVSPDSASAYVSRVDSTATMGALEVIDTATLAVVDSISLPSPAFGIAFAPDGSRAYAALLTTDELAVVDPLTNTVLTTIPIGGPPGPNTPAQIAITQDGAKAYVTNQNSGDVSVVDLVNESLVRKITVGDFPLGLAITPDGAFALVANAFSNSISIIDTSIDMVVNTIPTGQTTADVEITPDGARAFVIALDPASDAGSMLVIDLSTNTIIDTIPVGDGPVLFDLATLESDPTPEEAIDNTSDALTDIMESADSNRTERVAQRAIDALDIALTAISNEPPLYRDAVRSIAKAARLINKLLDEGGIDEAEATALLVELADAARGLAIDAINAAIERGGSANRIDTAQQFVLLGIDQLEAGDYEAAIESFKVAARKAQNA